MKIAEIGQAIAEALAEQDRLVALVERLSAKIKVQNAHLARETRISQGLDLYQDWEKAPDLELIQDAQRAIVRSLVDDILEKGLVRFEMTGSGEYRRLRGFLSAIRPDNPEIGEIGENGENPEF